MEYHGNAVVGQTKADLEDMLRLETLKPVATWIRGAYSRYALFYEVGGFLFLTAWQHDRKDTPWALFFELEFNIKDFRSRVSKLSKTLVVSPANEIYEDSQWKYQFRAWAKKSSS